MNRYVLLSGKPALLALIVCLGLTQSADGAPARLALAQSARSVDCFDIFELVLRIDNPDANNPFTDVAVHGEFGPPGEAPVPVDGFCRHASGTEFAMRFMPSRPGRHTFRITYRQGDFEWKREGQFTARKGKIAGPVRVDPMHPFHFVREGTSDHWFWNGTTTYQLLAWDDATIRQSIERLASLGVNRIRVALAGRTKDGMRWIEPLVKPTDKFKFKMEPWVAARPDNLEDPGYDVTRFNLRLFDKTDRLLKLARERDVVVSLIFYVDGADKGVDPFGKGRMGGHEEQLYYRYVVARFAAYPNIMWDVANEYRLFRDDAWAEKMGAFIKQSDPYDHLTSTHGHGDFRFRKSPWADFAMYQSWDEGGGYKFMLNNRREQAATGRPLPQINEEYGYEDHYPTGWGGAKAWPSRSGDNRRRLAWEMTMAGCYQTTGERANDGTGAGPDTGGGWVNGRGNEHMTMLLGYRHMKDFFTSIKWWLLEPREELAGAGTLVLADPGQCYVAYMPKGGLARLRLEPGTFSCRWFNPRTGAWQPPEMITSTGQEWTSHTPPDAGDWALLLQRK